AIEKSFVRSDGLSATDISMRDVLCRPLQSLRIWASSNLKTELDGLCGQYAEQSQSCITRQLAGPSGERNSYTIMPRVHVLFLA
ncbi:hypothetical protein, partial [Pseudomonas syringae group genomosp. 7]|uniref:hypothetical protein n=1 Tax=Pseudomonas syringae group genomosp. 7 TaxID=251699 RepID=UPI0037701678